MSRRPAGWRGWAAWLLLAAALAGCATPQRSAPPGQSWVGRLALSVAGQPDKSFSAGFELKGAPEAGELALYSPLGGVLAVLAWRPGLATLRSSDGQREFPSVEALALEATGAALPIQALFDWLQGRATEVPGWTVDLAQLDQGRLRAQRSTPTPPAELRLVFER